MSDHREMRKLTVKTGKKISAEAENTLQTTFAFKNQLSERIEAVSALRSEHDKLLSELEDLQKENARLASEPNPNDMELEKELKEVRDYVHQLQTLLEEETKQIKDADLAYRDLENQRDSLRETATIKAQEIEGQRELYRQVLKIDLQRIPQNQEEDRPSDDNFPSEQFRVSFLDLNQSVILRRESISHWQILGSSHPIEGNVYNWLEFTRMLCEARESLKEGFM